MTDTEFVKLRCKVYTVSSICECNCGMEMA